MSKETEKKMVAMDYRKREAIFSKEVITLEEMAQMLSVSLGTASVKMKEMKRKAGDRLGIQGRIHVADYLAYMELSSESARYSRPMDEVQDKKYEESIRQLRTTRRRTVNA